MNNEISFFIKGNVAQETGRGKLKLFFRLPPEYAHQGPLPLGRGAREAGGVGADIIRQKSFLRLQSLCVRLVLLYNLTFDIEYP